MLKKEDFFDLPPIESHFPHVFKNGAKWDFIVAECNGCKCDLKGELFRGNVVSMTDHVSRIEGIAICPDCKLIHNIEYRVTDDMTLIGLRNGEWVRWTGKKEDKSWPLWKHTILAIGMCLGIWRVLGK